MSSKILNIINIKSLLIILILIQNSLSQIISSSVGSITNSTVEYRAISKDGKKLKVIINDNTTIGEISQPTQNINGLYIYIISYKTDLNDIILLNNKLQVLYDDILQEKLTISFKNPELSKNMTVVFTSYIDLEEVDDKYFFKKVNASLPDSIIFIGDIIKYDDGGMKISTLEDRYASCKFNIYLLIYTYLYIY